MIIIRMVGRKDLARNTLPDIADMEDVAGVDIVWTDYVPDIDKLDMDKCMTIKLIKCREGLEAIFDLVDTIDISNGFKLRFITEDEQDKYEMYKARGEIK